jgi:hypothetical protein
MTMANKPPTPPTPDPKRASPETPKRRTPTDAQRDRLKERIAKLESDRDTAAGEAIDEIRKDADRLLKERLAKTEAKIRARYAVRIEPFTKMLAALGEAP